MKLRLLSISGLLLAGCMNYLVSNCPCQPTHETVEIETSQIEVVSIEEVVNDEIEVIDNTEPETIEEPVIKNRWDIELTDEEIELLAKIVFLEAHTESNTGISAVIEVILNRIVSPLFPNTLEEVLSQKNPVQFTSWKNVGIAQPTETEYELIRQALSGETEVLSIDYLYFSRGKQNNADPIKIGAHWFCKQPK